MAEAPGTLDGWYALHDLRRFEGASELSPKAAEEAAELLAEMEQASGDGAGRTACYRILGHKGDLLFLYLRPTLEGLAEAEERFARTRLAEVTRRAYSYLSCTELSLYEAQARGGTVDRDALMESEFVRRRLYPPIPEDKPYVSFYPMTKSRGETYNWYAAGLEERRAMMREHGATGRKFSDRVQQMITGSVGFDDWEWGVTLWAADPLSIKYLVTAMRYDEVTARYAEFGPFHLGFRLHPEGLARLLTARSAGLDSSAAG